MTGRALILIAGAAAVLLVLVTVLVTVAVTGGGSSGDGSGGSPGEEAAQPPPPPADMTGYWNFVVRLEDQRYEMPEDEISFTLDVYEWENGALEGEGFAEYGSEDYEVEIREGESSYVRPDGYVSIVIVGEGDGSEEGVYDGYMSFTLEGQLSGDTIRPEEVSGDTNYYNEPDEQAIGAVTGFAAEKQ